MGDGGMVVTVVSTGIAVMVSVGVCVEVCEPTCWGDVAGSLPLSLPRPLWPQTCCIYTHNYKRVPTTVHSVTTFWTALRPTANISSKTGQAVKG